MLRKYIVAAVLVASVIAVYSLSLNAPFQFDDDAGIVLNTSIQNIRDIKAILFFKPELPRPLFNLSLAIDYAIYGLKPWGYRVTNLVIHLLACWFVWLIAIRVNKAVAKNADDNATTAATLAAFIFALHPLATETTIYIWSRSSSLMTLFSLMTIYTYLTAFNSGVSLKRLALSLVCFAAALLSKEEALTLPALLLAVDLTLFDREGRVKRLIHSIPYWLAPAGAAVYRLMAKVTMYDVVSWRVTEADEFGELVLERGVRGIVPVNLFTQFKAALFYLGELITPINQSVDHGIAFETGFPSLGAIAGIILMAALAMLFFFKRKEYPRVALFAAFFAVPLSIFFVVPVSDAVVERRLYLPLAGWAILLGAALKNVRRGATFYSKSIRIDLVILPLLAMGALTANRTLVWHDRVGLWDNAIRVSPGKLRPRVIMARLMYESGNVYRAIHENLAAIRIKENHSPPIVNLGVIYMDQGAYDVAERYFRQAVHWHPGADFNARFNLAIALSRQGKDDEAVAELLETIKLNPGHALAMQEIGRIYAQHDDPSNAAAWFRKALSISPDLATARMNLGMSLVDAGRVSEGLDELTKAAMTAPGDGLIWFNLGFSLLRAGRNDDAVAAFSNGTKDAGRPETWFGLGQAYIAKGMNREAADALGKFVQLTDLRRRPELAPMVESAKKSLGL